MKFTRIKNRNELLKHPVLLFYRILWIFSASKGFSAGHYSDVNVDVLGRTIPEEEMCLVCLNLQVGADICALYNRVVLSCSTECLCKLWNSCEWWKQTLAGGHQRSFSRKIYIVSIKHPYQCETIRNLYSKKFIWDTCAEKESVRKIQGRNYDEGTERTPRKKCLEHQKIFTLTRDLRSLQVRKPQLKVNQICMVIRKPFRMSKDLMLLVKPVITGRFNQLFFIGFSRPNVWIQLFYSIKIIYC